MDKINQPKYVSKYKIRNAIDLTWIVEKYRPKLIQEKIENGVVVKIYEAR